MSNMRQIARLANVSLATVSLALRDHPRISAATRERVKEIARTLNYLPRFERPGNGSSFGVIGYVIHNTFGVVATDILRGAMEEALRRKFGILMMQVSQDETWIEEAIHNLQDLNVNGLVMAHSYTRLLPRRILLGLRSCGIHVVQVMNKVFSDPVDAVCRNEAEYARVAADHLGALAHRRALGLHMNQPDIWAKQFKACGIELTFIEPGRGGETLIRTFDGYLQMSPRPTAMIASTDEDAFRLYTLAGKHGLSVSGDLSVMGMGNMFGTFYYPEITTVDLGARDIGRAGIGLLADRIAAGVPPHEITEFADLYLPATLIKRGSTGPAPRR